jgi:hypothetical protein
MVLYYFDFISQCAHSIVCSDYLSEQFEELEDKKAKTDQNMMVMDMLINKIKKEESFDASMESIFGHLVKLDPKMCPHGWEHFKEAEKGEKLGLHVLFIIIYLGFSRILNDNVIEYDM